MIILQLIGRSQELFVEDITKHEKELAEIVSSSCFLVIGGAGSRTSNNQENFQKKSIEIACS